MTYLTANFTLEEFITSETAARRGIDNTPNDEVKDNLLQLAQTMEQVRYVLGNKPIISKSGYRSPKLNAAIGGAKNSQHILGQADDFICPQFGSPAEICREIMHCSNIKFDQLICEGSWVHLSIADVPRMEVLTAHFKNGKVTYTSGLND